MGIDLQHRPSLPCPLQPWTILILAAAILLLVQAGFSTTVTITAKGTVISGYDDSGADITGRPFTLILVFDDAQGQLILMPEVGFSEIGPTSTSFVGSGTLHIDGGVRDYPLHGDDNSMIGRNIVGDYYRLTFQVGGVSGIISVPIVGKPNFDWRASFPQLAPLNDPIRPTFVQANAGGASAELKLTSVSEEGSSGILNPPPSLTLTKATTTDGQNVTVDYTLSDATLAPIHFDIFRSDHESVNGSSTKIGEKNVTQSANLTKGNHDGVTLLSGINLPPDTAQPFVVVVANRNIATDTAYFRKWLLGVVTHGYDAKADGYHGYFNPDLTTPEWETLMAHDLTLHHYDNVIALNWQKDCATPEPNMATTTGDALYQQVYSYVADRSKGHPGDVVDIHFIAHSRGTVVVSRTLIDMAQVTDPTFSGSYVQVTLLDPHPANSTDGNQLSVETFYLNFLYDLYLRFQYLARDPRVTLPANAGIRKISIWYQKTPWDSFPVQKENMLRLWGEGEPDNLIINNAGIGIDWHDLTGKTLVQDGSSFVIGHSEVHDYYRIKVIEVGNVP